MEGGCDDNADGTLVATTTHSATLDNRMRPEIREGIAEVGGQVKGEMLYIVMRTLSSRASGQLIQEVREAFALRNNQKWRKTCLLQLSLPISDLKGES